MINKVPPVLCDAIHPALFSQEQQHCSRMAKVSTEGEDMNPIYYSDLTRLDVKPHAGKGFSLSWPVTWFPPNR